MKIPQLFVATRKGLFTIAKHLGAWDIVDVSFEGDNVSMVLPDTRDGAVYVAIQHGHFGSKLHRSDDDGKTWKELTAPQYPPKPESEVDKDPIRGEDVAWSLQLIWSLEAAGDQRIFAGTVPGGLFYSDDRGESFNLCESLWLRPERRRWFGGGLDAPGIHSIVVDPADGNHVLIAVSCGGIWRTRDGGGSFTLEGKGMHASYMPPERRQDLDIQDPHRLVQCASKPEVLWVQHHNGIFRSTDYAESFVEISGAKPSSFGFTVAAHPKDPEVAWFVPAARDDRRIPVDRRVAVMRTSDGGRSFEPLTRGLPDQFAYDLVYRHALDVDATGALLAFGSTTGNLWISENGGDAFATVSQNLPPIYAVRFQHPHAAPALERVQAA
ncbi:MAG TPA: hypothetical protein VFQ61_20445 [Polyangiaceae bacterium]|nr:hypothetical protein [Polyangiaceae bacterium]